MFVLLIVMRVDSLCNLIYYRNEQRDRTGISFVLYSFHAGFFDK